MKLGKRIGDVSDLPEELLRQLNATKKDLLETQIIETIRGRYEGSATIDEILVGLFRDYQVVQKRGYITGKLYRMVTDGLLGRLPKRRGVFTTASSD